MPLSNTEKGVLSLFGAFCLHFVILLYYNIFKML